MSYDYKKKRNVTSFVSKPKITKVCKECSCGFQTTPKNRKVLCSTKCSSIYNGKKRSNSDSLKKRIIELYNQGVKYKDIASQLNIHQGTVSSVMNKALYRNKRTGQRDNITKCKSVYKECYICKFDRIVEMAHIIPAHKGGTYSLDNIIGLCPNHHHLFDNKRLTKDEAFLLKDRIENFEDYIAKPSVKVELIYKAVDLKTNEETVYKSMELNNTPYCRHTINKCVRGLFKQAYGKKWYKYKQEVLNG